MNLINTGNNMKRKIEIEEEIEKDFLTGGHLDLMKKVID